MAGLETAIVGALTKALIPIGLSKVEEANTSFNHFCKNKFIPYIARGYTQLDKSTSQLFRNRNYLVSKLYEPLTLSSHSSEQSAVVDKYPSDLFNAHSKIIINDDSIIIPLHVYIYIYICVYIVCGTLHCSIFSIHILY